MRISLRRPNRGYRKPPHPLDFHPGDYGGKAGRYGVQLAWRLSKADLCASGLDSHLIGNPARGRRESHRRAEPRDRWLPCFFLRRFSASTFRSNFSRPVNEQNPSEALDGVEAGQLIRLLVSANIGDSRRIAPLGLAVAEVRLSSQVSPAAGGVVPIRNARPRWDWRAVFLGECSSGT